MSVDPVSVKPDFTVYIFIYIYMQPIVNNRKDHSIYIIQFSEPKRALKWP